MLSYPIHVDPVSMSILGGFVSNVFDYFVRVENVQIIRKKWRSDTFANNSTNADHDHHGSDWIIVSPPPPARLGKCLQLMFHCHDAGAESVNSLERAESKVWSQARNGVHKLLFFLLLPCQEPGANINYTS